MAFALLAFAVRLSRASARGAWALSDVFVMVPPGGVLPGGGEAAQVMLDGPGDDDATASVLIGTLSAQRYRS